MRIDSIFYSLAHGSTSPPLTQTDQTVSQKRRPNFLTPHQRNDIQLCIGLIFNQKILKLLVKDSLADPVRRQNIDAFELSVLFSLSFWTCPTENLVVGLDEIISLNVERH